MTTTLDHMDGITVPGDVFSEPVNEYWALVFLHQGLNFLYRQAVRCDRAIAEKVNPEGNQDIVMIGNGPELADIPKAMLTCAFHWYAISACQYVGTVGAIALREDTNRPLPKEYIERVIPEVLTFRDKVAAHFAWMTENKRDNVAERLASIMPPLGFVNDAFYVGGAKVTTSRGGKVTDSSSIKPWSISKVHEQLQQRYWPEELVRDR